MSTIAANVDTIQARIRAAAGGREVRLIGITKTVSPDRILEAFAAGVSVFGENRIQEALPKITALSDHGITWHFVGHLQTNKTKEAVEHFVCIQSVDSLKLLQHVEKEAAKRQKRMPVLLEINLAAEEAKHGLAEEALETTLAPSVELQHVSITGLMAIPPFFDDPEQVRPYFRRMRGVRDRLQRRFSSLVDLSMGMSHDYVVAIEEGATMVRIGTALFGARKL